MNEKDFALNSSFDLNHSDLSTNFFYNDDHNASFPSSNTSDSKSSTTTKGIKLARIRSFKDDFLEKISQMRTPTSTLTRSNSPMHKKGAQTLFHHDDKKSSSRDLEQNVKQVKHALTHFKDVINKNKLEMLPGNGTILLEIIANINSSIKSNKYHTKSSAVISATQQVQTVLGKLIKLCDDALISEDEQDFIALNKDSVKELVEQLIDGVTNLVDVASEKNAIEASQSMQRPKLSDMEIITGQRNSLPDITTTPRDENGKFFPSSSQVRASHSSENILSDDIDGEMEPPPKPSRHLNVPIPPSIPPKKPNTQNTRDSIDSCNNAYTIRSKSPDMNSSIGSMGSMLNNLSIDNDFNHLDIEDIKFNVKNSVTSVENKFSSSSFEHRTSNESGFVSITSQSNIFKKHQEQMIVTTQEHSSPIMMSSSHSQDDVQKISNLDQQQIVISSPIQEFIFNSDDAELPPPLPVKTRSKKFESQRSLYDNVEASDPNNSLLTVVTTSSSNSSLASSSTITSFSNTFSHDNSFEFHQHSSTVKNKYFSCIEPRNLMHDGSMLGADSGEDKPPLPPKKNKHMFQSVAYSVMAYMEIFGNAQVHIQNDSMMARHSMHTFSQSSKIFSNNDILVPSIPPKITSSEVKPALPPKKLRLSSTTKCLPTPPQSPHAKNDTHSFSSPTSPTTPINFSHIEDVKTPTIEVIKTPQKLTNESEMPCNNNDINVDDEEVILRKKPEKNLIEEMEISGYLTFKRDDEDGPDIKGGEVDALIVHATKVQKISEAFGEAFLATYRTFIEPYNLVEKLTHRYSFFNKHINDQKQKAAKETFSLLVRVTNDLTLPDLTKELMQKLIDFVHNLVISGEIFMAKLLRAKAIEKALLLRQRKQAIPKYLSATPIISNPPTLLDLKSTEIAEQMTILDAELFQKIEIPEVLVWAQEQNEERSPNLALFTAHFNNLSYWARTQILKQNDAKDREKYVMKFIKIMKHLRKINNYNSYLALLSALDSAPIRRLEWQKNITEGLKEYCALIDSSSSFRAYRQALSETQGSCIPYIGLVLQDLTFVHIGNPDFLPDGSINFSKRWQQYNIVMNMKRFRKSSYTYKKNDRIIGFFDNFEEYFDEDAMWQISEKIKPRNSSRKPTT